MFVGERGGVQSYSGTYAFLGKSAPLQSMRRRQASASGPELGIPDLDLMRHWRLIALERFI